MTDEYYSDIPIQMLRNKRILEIGSGTGENQLRSRHYKIFIEQSLRGEYLGIDKDLNEHPLLSIIEADVRDFVIVQQYDTILMMHCLEHIPEEDWVQVFNILIDSLKEGGWLIVACPYNEGSERPHSPDHVVFNINESVLSSYLPNVQMFKSGIKYSKGRGGRKAIWWFRQFLNGERFVPLGMARHSFIAFWRKERE